MMFRWINKQPGMQKVSKMMQSLSRNSHAYTFYSNTSICGGNGYIVNLVTCLFSLFSKYNFLSASFLHIIKDTGTMLGPCSSSTHSFAYSYRCFQKCFVKICETSKCHNFHIFQSIFIKFSLFLFEIVYSFF